MRKRATSARTRVLLRAGLLPGLIAAGIVFASLAAAGVFSTYVPERRGCSLYELQDWPTLGTIPARCEDTDFLPLTVWTLSVLVVVMLIGLAVQALWPGWNDKT